MIGLIWFVQLVHYPLLAQISRYRAGAYTQTNMRLATWIFAPAMILELATAIVLAWRPTPSFPPALAWVGLSLIAIIWFSTAFLQAPKHEILAVTYVEGTHRALVRSNWVRTIAWSVRGVMLLYWVVG